MVKVLPFRHLGAVEGLSGAPWGLPILREVQVTTRKIARKNDKEKLLRFAPLLPHSVAGA